MTTTILASFPSPSQGVWHLGPAPIRAYALFILAGVIAALFIGNKRWVDRGGESGVIFDIALWAIIFGLIGGRLYHVLTDWATYFGPGGAGFMAAFKIQEGGLGIWGAVALGGVGAWIGCRRKGIPLPAFGDAVAPGIVLAQAIGRIGNYFNQELYGRSTSLPWGLEIYERRDVNGALDSLNGASTGQLIEIVHPTFLYELLWNLLVFALLIWIDRRYRIGHGRLFALYVAAYCFGRFWIELMRSDMATHIAGIRINSFVSVFVFIGAVVYIMVAPKGREDPSELRGDTDDGEKLARDEDEQLPAGELARELAAVAATTGVVAAAKTAGERGDDDAVAVETSDADSTVVSEDEAEPIFEAEQLAESIKTAPAEDIAAVEEFAEAGEAEAAESFEEAAELADEVAVESEEPEESEGSEGSEGQVSVTDDATPGEAGGGVGAVEGDEVVEAEEAAPEVHEAAVERAEVAADEVAVESEESEESEGQVSVTDDATPGEAGGGVGAVEGDEVVEAEEAAPEVHEAAVERAEEAAEVADDVAEDSAKTASEAERSADVAEEPAEHDARRPVLGVPSRATRWLRRRKPRP